MNYMIFYSGVASTPYEVGLKNLTTNEIVCRISTDRPKGEDCRKAYKKYLGILNKKYKHLLN